MENTMLFWYWATSLVLCVILFFPTRKFIASMIANRFQRKENRAVTDEEMKRIRQRAGIVAAVLVVTFAFIYNKFIMFKYYGGGQ